MSSKCLIFLTVIASLQLAMARGTDLIYGYESNRPTSAVDPTALKVDEERIRPPPINDPYPVGAGEFNVDGGVRPAPTIEESSFRIDTTFYYRLRNNYSGRNRALDVVNDGRDYALKMAPVGDYSGQFWYFVRLGHNVYNIRCRFLGDAYSLDIFNDGTNDKPHMAKTNDVTGQRWHFLHLSDGTFRLYNDFSGNRRFLDVYRDTHIPHMYNNDVDYSGQHWFFTKTERI
jgi:hypothetical protein